MAIYPFRDTLPAEDVVLAGDHGEYLRFRGIGCALGKLNASDHFATGNIVAGLCLPLMNRGAAPKLAVVVRAFECLSELEPIWNRRAKYAGFVSQYSGMTRENIAELRRDYIHRSPKGEDLMSILEQIGEERGRAKEIVVLFRKGLISADQAREILDSHVKSGEMPEEVAASAQKQIDESR